MKVLVRNFLPMIMAKYNSVQLKIVFHTKSFSCNRLRRGGHHSTLRGLVTENKNTNTKVRPYPLRLVCQF